MPTQRRSTEYRSNDSSYSNNLAKLAGIPPGLYHGFDATLGASMTLTLDHQTTGFEETQLDGTLAPKAGVLLSRQGVFIIEPDTIALPVEPVTDARYDLVVCSHAYVEVQNGQAATYSIIAGGYNPNYPDAPLPPDQIRLGVLTLPAGCTALNQTGVIYTPYHIPSLKELGSLRFTKYDTSQNDVFVVPDVDYETGWTYGDANNKFRVLKTQSGQIYFAGRVKATAGMSTLLLMVDNEQYLPARAKFMVYAFRPTLDSSVFIEIPVVIGFTGTNSKVLQIQNSYTPQADDIISFDGVTFPFF